jgi:hypothetical protein
VRARGPAVKYTLSCCPQHCSCVFELKGAVLVMPSLAATMLIGTKLPAACRWQPLKACTAVAISSSSRPSLVEASYPVGGEVQGPCSKVCIALLPLALQLCVPGGL